MRYLCHFSLCVISFWCGFLSQSKQKQQDLYQKKQKGYANYWLYKKIHSEIGLGHIYILNVFLLILTATYFCLAIFLGWVKFLSLPIAICNSLLCTVQIPSIIFSDIYWNLEYHKKKFVVLAKNKAGRGFHSSFYAIIEVIGLLVFAIYNISLTLRQYLFRKNLGGKRHLFRKSFKIAKESPTLTKRQ